MTRETAIEILKELWRTKYPLYLESDIRKALEMAIKALEFLDKIADTYGDMFDIPKELKQEPSGEGE